MRIINTFGSKEHPLQNIICSWKDAKYLSGRFAAFKYPLADKFCDFMKANHLMVGIMDTYDSRINWHGAHFYVGGKKDKYCDRPDLSVNGFSLTAGEVIDFMNGKKKDKWFKHCKEDGKEKEIK